MSKHDLQSRPVYHHKRESIEAHLTIEFAALAVSHWIEHQTGWSIKKFVRTALRYRTVKIQAGQQIFTAGGPQRQRIALHCGAVRERITAVGLAAVDPPQRQPQHPHGDNHHHPNKPRGCSERASALFGVGTRHGWGIHRR